LDRGDNDYTMLIKIQGEKSTYRAVYITKDGVTEQSLAVGSKTFKGVPVIKQKDHHIIIRFIFAGDDSDADII
jgi:hypothetical protein